MLDTFVKSKISNRQTQILPLAYALTYCACTYMFCGENAVEHNTYARHFCATKEC